MKSYRVTLHRSYFVDIEAKNKTDAQMLTEYFLGYPTDDSSENDRQERTFKFHGIELAINDAADIEEIVEEERGTLLHSLIT